MRLNPDGTWRMPSPEEEERTAEQESQDKLLYEISEAHRAANLRNPIMTDRVLEMHLSDVKTLAALRWAGVASADATQDDDSAESKALRKFNSAIDEAEACYAAMLENAACKWIAGPDRIVDSDRGRVAR